MGDGPSPVHRVPPPPSRRQEDGSLDRLPRSHLVSAAEVFPMNRALAAWSGAGRLRPPRPGPDRRGPGARRCRPPLRRPLRGRAEPRPARRPPPRDALDRRQPEPRLPDQRRPQDAAGLRHRRGRAEAGPGGADRRRRPRATRSRASRTSRRAPTPSRPCSTATRPSAAPTATWSSCPWTAAKASSGTGARQPLQHAAQGHDRSRQGRHRSRSRSTRSSRPSRPAGDEVHQARAHPERAPDEVLGPAHAPGRARPAARGLRRRTRRRATRWSSTTATSRPTSAASARSRPTPT